MVTKFNALPSLALCSLCACARAACLLDRSFQSLNISGVRSCATVGVQWDLEEVFSGKQI